MHSESGGTPFPAEPGQSTAGAFPLLVLADADCFEVMFGESDSVGRSARVASDLPPGEYSLFVAAETDASYGLTMSCSEPVTCNDCIVGPVICGEPRQGRLTADDCEMSDLTRLDTYTLELSESGRVEIELGAINFDTVLTVSDEACKLIAFNDDCDSSNSCLNLTLEAGVYRVGVGSYFPGEVGTYLLRVEADGCDSCAACDGQVIEPGQTAPGTLTRTSCGRLNGFPADVWELSTQVETTLSIDLASAAFDPVLAVRNAECEELLRNDDCDIETLGSCLSLTLGPGTYALAVGSFLPNAMGDYTLSVGDLGGGNVLPGDCDGDRTLAIDDALCLLAPLFTSRDPVLPCGDGTPADAGNLMLLDFDSAGTLNVSDAVRLLRFLFHGGPPHPLGLECTAIPACPSSCDA